MTIIIIIIIIFFFHGYRRDEDDYNIITMPSSQCSQQPAYRQVAGWAVFIACYGGLRKKEA